MPTIRETTALVLLYRACHDENLRAKVRGWLPEVAELADDALENRCPLHKTGACDFTIHYGYTNCRRNNCPIR